MAPRWVMLLVWAEVEGSDLEPLFMGLHTLEPEDAVRVARLEEICDGVGDAAAVAGSARPAKTGTYAYGEVLVGPFACLLREQRPQCPACGLGGFVDLGSGAGRAVLAAALLGGFEQCLGVEVLEPLSGLAEAALALCRIEWPALPEVTFRCADLREEAWWQGAAVAFCNAITWPEDLLLAIGVAAAKLSAGARLLVVGRALPERATMGLFTVSRAHCDMDWAPQVPIWVYARTP